MCEAFEIAWSNISEYSLIMKPASRAAFSQVLSGITASGASFNDLTSFSQAIDPLKEL